MTMEDKTDVQLYPNNELRNINMNIGNPPPGSLRNVTSAGYVIAAVFITIVIMFLGMCALWCRKQYKYYLYEKY